MSEAKGTLARSAALLAPTLAGLVASAILLVDYVRPAPVFCDEGGGCDAVKRTAFAAFLGVPTPAYGVAAFLALGLLALQQGARVRLAQVVLAGVGTGLALFLIAVQVTLGRFCPFCLTADVSTCLVLAAAIFRYRGAWDLPSGAALRFAGGGALAVALAVPLAVGFTRKPKPPPVPEVVAAEMARTPEGQVTVVDFADFECPFCRRTHAALAPVVEASKGRVRVVRKQVPLVRIHRYSLDAARAACCAESLGKGDAMADALFTAPVEELTPEGCARLAASLGLDRQAFRACVDDPKTDARIDADITAFRAAKGHGLPTLWIDGEKLEGMQSEESLKSAILGAIARKG